MRNYVQRGDTLDATLVADTVSGDVVIIGKLKGVATCNGKAGEQVAVVIEGCVSLPKAGAVTFAQGAPVSWDDAANTAVASGGALIGYASAAAGAGATEVQVKLCPSAA